VNKTKENNISGILILAFLSFVLMGFFSIISEDIGSPVNSNEDMVHDISEKERDSSIYDMLSNGYSPYMPDPTPFTITQPDGSTFEASRVGERIGGHIETLEGYTIMEGEGGWWTYADKNERGELVPTEYHVGSIEPRSIRGLQKHLANDYPEVEDNTKKYERSTRAPPTNTTWKAVAIMLEFTDETFDTVTKSDFETMLNGTSGQTMRTYYQEVSYGLFDIEVDVVGPFTSTQTMGYYGADIGPNDSNPNTRDDGNVSISQMAREAVQLADPTVDFNIYDVDSDGNIDALFVIHAGVGQEGGGPSYAIWSHMSFIGYMTNDGVMATRYSTEPENGKVGVFAHEFGHILGLPDLYDTDYSSSGIGKWGVMAGGSWNGGGNSPAHFCAWAKIELGWLEPTIVTSDLSLSQLEIPPVETNPIVYKIWAFDPSVNSMEYFLVENRQKIGYDSALPAGGILVWHIDDMQGGNQDETHYLVDLEEADGDQELEAGGASEATDPWKNNLTGFRHNTMPNSTSYNGTYTGVWVWNFSSIQPDDNMSVGFNELYSGPLGIFISDPVSNSSILPVYDFVLNDTGFPDEDVGADNDGNNGSYTLEWRPNGTADPWVDTPGQTMISWQGGGNGIINSTLLTEGFWDFRARIYDEEGHLFYTPEVYNVAVPTKIPPNADAGPDNLTDVLRDTILDGSGSTDNSGFIPWFNWSFGDGSYKNGTQPIVTHNWTDPGIYTVTLNVSDSFGNWDIDIVNITVEDLGAPVTSLNIANPKYTEHPALSMNVTSKTIFTLLSVDNYVGVNFTWYTIDGVYFDYTGQFNFSGYSEGPHDFTWGAEDMVGNNETGNFLFIVVDDTAPVTDIIIGSPKYRSSPSDIWNVTNLTGFFISAWDQYAGIDYTWHSIDGNFTISDTFDLQGYGDGERVIYWSSVDHVGNYEDKNITVRLDTTPPDTDIEFGEPKYRSQPGDRWNFTTSTELSLANATDGTGVGLNYTWYTIDGAYYLYSGNFSLSPGLHTITWGGIDYLGINESENLMEIYVDNEPPVSSLLVGSPSFGMSPTYVDLTTPFIITGSDGLGSGIDYSYYNIDGGTWTLYTGPFNVPGSGTHTIFYNSTDHFGFEESTRSFDILVDNQPPTTSISIGDPKYGSFPQYIDSTTPITLTSSDGAESGVQYIMYRIDSGGWNLYSGPFPVPTPGPHTIYYNATDWVEHQEVTKSYNVTVDNNAPSILLTIGEPKIGSSPTRVGIATTFNLTAWDGPGSGVASIFYNIGATGWVLYTGNFTVSIPGNVNVYYYATDNLGHSGLNEQIDLFVDTEPPTTSLTVGDPKYGSFPTYVDTITEFNLTSSDGPGCGVESTWYRIDSGNWMRYTGNFIVATPGPHIIYFNSTDILGQDEITQTIDIVVDDSPPDTTMVVGDPKYGSSPTFVNATTNFTLVTSDGSGSGVSFVKWRYDGSAWLTYSGEFKITSPGPHTIDFYSSDNLGHDEPIDSISIIVEIDPPFAQINIGDPKYASSPTFINSSTEITLSSSDGSGSGVAEIWFRIDSGIYTLYTGPFTIPSQDLHQIFYYSIDNLGHQETLRGFNVFVDNSLPDTTLDVGDPQYGSSPTNVNLVTPITLSASDGTGSGVKSTWYRIDSGPWISYTGSFSMPSEGLHTAYYYSADNLDQMEPEKSFDLYCDITAPGTDVSIGDPKYRADLFDVWNITLDTKLDLSSVDSDVALIWYTIDGDYFEGTQFDLQDHNLEEGFYDITWGAIDHLGNNETGKMLTVFLETTTPTTELTVGNPKYRDSPTDDWIITAQTDFYAYSFYQKSGIKATWYTIDGDYYEGNIFDLSSYPDGPHTITWGTIDNLGHNETGNALDVVLDSGLGFVDLVMGEPRYRAQSSDHYNVTTQTPFTLTLFSQYPDVDHTWYSVDGNELTGTSFDLLGYQEGLRTIEFGTYDDFGTKETWETILVYLDNSPPTTSLEIDEPKYQDPQSEMWKVTQDTSFILTSFDSYSGVSFIWYSLDGEMFLGDSFDLDGLTDGDHIITWGSSDNLNFNETGNELELEIDTSPPEIGIEIGQPNSTQNTVIEITSSTLITLTSRDSDPTVIYYKVDGWTEFIIYTGPFTIPDSTTEIIYYGMDPLNNSGEETTFEVTVNNNDHDDDGKPDLVDEDDDNDGLYDHEEDLNQNGILDEGESDPLNADTDSDGHIDSEDKYPQDSSKYRDPTNWEKIPLLGGYEQGLCITFIIIGIILLILLLYLFRRYRMYRAKSSWEKEAEGNGSTQNGNGSPPNNK
jgi:M6 family metalloprotease-like protein